MQTIQTFLMGLTLNEIIALVIGIFVVVFVLKKLFKLALTLAAIVVIVYYGLPIIQKALY